MSVSQRFHTLALLGPFRFFGPDGARISVPSKRGQALLAMLAMAGSGERTRGWLQERLWGSRAPAQAQASLRRELSTLRTLLNTDDAALLEADHDRIRLNLARVQVDARNLDAVSSGDFLEGLDIAGEESFEDWLREERARLAARAVAAPAHQPAASSVTTTPPGFEDLPALAVLPFTNLTGDAAHDFLAEGISEDLIDRMSRLRWLPVIARSSSFSVRDTLADPKQIGALLGARYLLDGRLRGDGGRLSLAAALTDTDSGQTIWSNKLDLADGMAAEALELLLTGLTSSLGARIDVEEQSRALRKPQSDLNVRDLIWKGRWHLNRFTKADSVLAKSCFEEALAKEPNSPEALIQIAWANLWDIWAQRQTDADTRAVRQMAQSAILADYDDARGHYLAGVAECWLRQPLRSEMLVRRAIDLNPSLVLAHAQLGSTLYLKGEPEAAITALDFAQRLSPNDQHLFYIFGERAMARLMTGDDDGAIADADAALVRRPAYWYAHVIKIGALVRAGNAGARAALDELQASKSGFTPAFIDWLPFIDSRWIDFLKDGLNQAAD